MAYPTALQQRYNFDTGGTDWGYYSGNPDMGDYRWNPYSGDKYSVDANDGTGGMTWYMGQDPNANVDPMAGFAQKFNFSTAYDRIKNGQPLTQADRDFFGQYASVPGDASDQDLMNGYLAKMQDMTRDDDSDFDKLMEMGVIGGLGAISGGALGPALGGALGVTSGTGVGALSGAIGGATTSGITSEGNLSEMLKGGLLGGVTGGAMGYGKEALGLTPQGGAVPVDAANPGDFYASGQPGQLANLSTSNIGMPDLSQTAQVPVAAPAPASLPPAPSLPNLGDSGFEVPANTPPQTVANMGLPQIAQANTGTTTDVTSGLGNMMNPSPRFEDLDFSAMGPEGTQAGATNLPLAPAPPSTPYLDPDSGAAMVMNANDFGGKGGTNLPTAPAPAFTDPLNLTPGMGVTPSTAPTIDGSTTISPVTGMPVAGGAAGLLGTVKNILTTGTSLGTAAAAAGAAGQGGQQPGGAGSPNPIPGVNLGNMVGAGIDYAGQQAYRNSLLGLMDKAIERSDPFYGQRSQYQDLYKQANTDPNWLNNDATLQSIQNSAMRGVASQDAARGYLGSGNILHDLTRTSTEATAPYALQRMQQLGVAAGAYSNPAAAGQQVANFGLPAAGTQLGQYGAIQAGAGAAGIGGVNDYVNNLGKWAMNEGLPAAGDYLKNIFQSAI